MSGTGINYLDLAPLPEKTYKDEDFKAEEKTSLQAESPTASHALAKAEHDERGYAQTDHGLEVKSLGWNEPKQRIPSPLVGGLDNEELWLLVRRFNKQIYHVKETTSPAAGNLDMNVADEDEFSPDKLRSTIERLYMTVIVSMLGVSKHMVRLRSWREPRRTACFAAVYFFAWIFDFLVPATFLVIIILIVYPPSRDTLFPPAPIALVDGKTGGPKKPKAGVLGSHDSARGSPENHRGEAVEVEAQKFVNDIGTMALSSIAGKMPQNDRSLESEEGQDSVSDSTDIATSATKTRVSAASNQPATMSGETNASTQAAAWNHSVADLVDTWERFANALSPTPPFPQEVPRLRLAAIIVPSLAMSLMVTSYIFTKGLTFGIGSAFFGHPIISRVLTWLNKTVPNWRKLLEIRNTMLKGVPTNAQLTITLLRVGEANSAPLPPPPRANQPPPKLPAQTTESELSSTGADAPLGASQAEIREAMSPNALTADEVEDSNIDAAQSKVHSRKGSKIIRFLKGSVKTSVETAIRADKIKAATGSAAAKGRLGAVSKDNQGDVSGPVDFKARYQGKKGNLCIHTNGNVPRVSFTVDHLIEKFGEQDRKETQSVWSIAIADIKGIKKINGYDWKAKLVVGWSLDTTIADGMEISDREGNTWQVTAIPLREELFNRLVAMGGQKWESW